MRTAPASSAPVGLAATSAPPPSAGSATAGAQSAAQAAPTAFTPPPAEVLAAPPAVTTEPGTPPPAELFAAPAPTPEGPTIDALPMLTADLAVEQVVERAPLPPEARLLARTMRPTLVAEYEDGYWYVSAGTLGRWRVSESTWHVEPADGVAELWEIQSRLDLR